ncbi:hypothetical protein QZH41_018692 [Actinostola sp. cb2023]|nr:hypothetical protein QZH41_018692 [Actinostola sp. cb2023]
MTETLTEPSSPPKTSTPEFDDVFKHHIKEFGRYQNFLYWLTYYLFIPLGLQFGLMVFVTGTPNFRCSDVNSTCELNKCCDECTDYTFEGPFSSIVSEVVCTGVASAVDSLSLFALLRFGAGFSLVGVMVTQYVYVLELVGPSKRTMAGKVTDFGWVLGACFTVMLAYLIREWRLLLLVGSVPGALFLFSFKLVPETARWLFAHDKCDEAHAVLMKCADKTNVDSEVIRTILEDVAENEKENANILPKVSPLDLIKTRKMRRRTIIVCFNWFGRRVTYFTIMMLGGIACLLVLAIPKEYTAVVTTMAMFGKFCDTAAFSTIYLYTAELYPTVIRNTAMGTASMCARAGGIVAPYIVMMAQLPGVNLTLPIVIFGALTVSGGISSLWLPETLKANMHQTIEEEEAAPEDYSFPCCRKPAVNEDNIELHETMMSQKEH